MAMKINKICVLGAGRMGASISLRSAMFGYNVTIYEPFENARKFFPGLMEITGKEAIGRGHLTQEKYLEAIQRIKITGEASEAADNTDLLIEAIPEILELKRKVLAQFDQICPPKTIITTNSSSLLASEIETTVKRKPQFAALHFTNWQSFVDIAAGTQSSPETIQTLMEYVRSIKEYPIKIKKEKDGYVHNNIWIEMRMHAYPLIFNEVSTIEEIDRAEMIYHRSSPGYGPFAEMDRMGLDVVLQITEIEYQRTKKPELVKVINFLKRYVERGELGQKTGKGFYTYPNPVFKKDDFIKV